MNFGAGFSPAVKVAKPLGLSMSIGSPNSGKLIGRALLIGTRAAQEDSDILARQGLQVELSAEPYAAMAELASRPLVYRALVLPLSQLFPEELALARVVKKRFPHVQIFASEVPARISGEELKRLGVDAVLNETGLNGLGHSAEESGLARTAGPARGRAGSPTNFSDVGAGELKGERRTNGENERNAPMATSSGGDSEAVLTAEELRALLHEDPLPPSGTEQL